MDDVCPECGSGGGYHRLQCVKERTRLVARVRELEAALRRHGNHFGACNSLWRDPCNCGYDAALGDAAKEAGDDFAVPSRMVVSAEDWERITSDADPRDARIAELERELAEARRQRDESREIHRRWIELSAFENDRSNAIGWEWRHAYDDARALAEQALRVGHEECERLRALVEFLAQALSAIGDQYRDRSEGMPGEQLSESVARTFRERDTAERVVAAARSLDADSDKKRTWYALADALRDYDATRGNGGGDGE